MYDWSQVPEKDIIFRHKIKKCKSTTHLVTSSHRNLGMPIIVGNLEPGKKRESKEEEGEEGRGREKGKFGPNFKLAISSKPGRSHPIKLVCMHFTSTPTCMNFLSRF